MCLTCLITFGCKQESDRIATGKMAITVRVSRSEFDEVGKKAARTSGEINANATVQQRTLPLDKDLVLAVELSPGEVDRAKEEITALRAAAKAEVQQNVKPGVKYKVVVYDNGGLYITERDYVRGEESNTEELLLDGGKNYTFIAYSINSTSDNPAVSFADPANKTLAGSSLSAIAGDEDFMYYRKDMNITTGENYLDLIFKHKFSQIVTTLDASAGADNITAVEATFNSHYPNANIQLGDATITRTGTMGAIAVSFTGLNTKVLTASTILNGSTATASLHISKLTMGSTTRTDIPTIDSLSITPGVSYNLKLTVTQKDRNLVHQGIYATRVNGMIWMRHNLGANYNLDPDQNPSVRALIGNYYQFGRKAVVATSSTGNGAISGWNKTAGANNAWNSGTESAPVKTANDPCPDGFRLPTQREMQELIDNTTASNIGTWTSNSNDNTIGAAKVLTSKNDPSIKLTFPATGYRNADQGILYWRGGSGLYWLSTGIDVERGAFLQNSVGIGTGNTGQPQHLAKTSGFTIRCIAE